MKDSIRIHLTMDNLLIDSLYYGGNQDWYMTYHKRIAGCGPTTAATITMYEMRKNRKDIFSKTEMIKLMNELWDYITPGIMGVDKVEKYIEGYNNYLKKHNINFSFKEIKTTNASVIELANFITEALKSDHPIAFLNLDRGNEMSIDSWHWVTIVGIKIDRSIRITICDEGYLKEIDLLLWYKTTKREGSFVYYY